MRLAEILDRRVEDAAAASESALEHKRRIYGEAHPQTLASLGNLAAIQAARGELAEAATAYTESLDLFAELHGEQPHPDVAYTHGMLAWTMYRQGNFDRAHAQAREGLQIREALADDNPMLGWIPPMTGLTGLETGATDAAALLGPWSDDCATLDGQRALGTLVCLARAWHTAVDGECGSGLPPAATDETLSELSERWRAVHAAIGARCEGRAVTPSESLPFWVRTDQPGR